MNEIQKATNKILNKLEIAEMEAYDNYSFAKKYGKKAEQLETKKAWEQAQAVVVAVDQALLEMRDALEEKVGA